MSFLKWYYLFPILFQSYNEIYSFSNGHYWYDSYALAYVVVVSLIHNFDFCIKPFSSLLDVSSLILLYISLDF